MAYNSRQFVSEPNVDYLRYEPDWGGLANAFTQGAQRHRDNDFREASLKRETDRDRMGDERARIGEKQRAQEMVMQDRRSGQREQLYRDQEERRENEARLNRDKLTQADHEAILHELYAAINTPGQDPLTQQNRVRAAQEALKRAGYATEEVEDTPRGPTAPPLGHDGQPAAPAQAPAPVARSAMSRADVQTSKDLDKAGDSYVKKLTSGKPTVLPRTTGASSSRDAAASSELDRVESDYLGKLQGPSSTSGWIPGQPVTPRRRSAESALSDAMLAPDDPYNQIVR